MPDGQNCPDCVVGVLQKMEMESDAYNFCDACGWSEWDDEDFFLSPKALENRDLEEFEPELDWWG